MARRLMRAVYSVRERIADFRDAFISGGEYVVAFKDAGVEPDDSGPGMDKRSSGLVYDRRWRALAQSLSNLDVEVLEAEVIWGDAVRVAERELRRCAAEVRLAVIQILEARDRIDPAGTTSEEQRARQRNVLYDQSSPHEPDAFAQKVLLAVRKFEGIAKPHLTHSHKRRSPSRAP